jgi:hypothetical protein
LQTSSLEEIPPKKLEGEKDYFFVWYARKSRAEIEIHVRVDHGLTETTLLNLVRQALREAPRFEGLPGPEEVFA